MVALSRSLADPDNRTFPSFLLSGTGKKTTVGYTRFFFI